MDASHVNSTRGWVYRALGHDPDDVESHPHMPIWDTIADEISAQTAAIRDERANAARLIQHTWREVTTNPTYVLCRKRMSRM
jgi:hypothetical protein